MDTPQTLFTTQWLEIEIAKSNAEIAKNNAEIAILHCWDEFIELRRGLFRTVDDIDVILEDPQSEAQLYGALRFIGEQQRALNNFRQLLGVAERKCDQAVDLAEKFGEIATGRVLREEFNRKMERLAEVHLSGCNKLLQERWAVVKQALIDWYPHSERGTPEPEDGEGKAVSDWADLD